MSAGSPSPPEGEESGAPSISAPSISGAAPYDPPAPSDRDLADLAKNDIGNGERLRERHGRDLLVVDELQRDLRDGWLVWSGKCWEPKKAYAEVRRRAHLTAKAMLDEARALEDDPPEINDFHKDAAKMRKEFAERVEAAYKWAVGSGNQAKCAAMLQAAAPYLLISQEELDTDPLLLNVANGTLRLPPPESQTPPARPAAREPGADLEEDEDAAADFPTRPHDRADRLSRLAPVDYDPEAACPRFEGFLETVLPDPEVRAFVQRFFGYALTGQTGGQVLLLFFGHGANGKSTFLNIMRAIYGSYAVSIPFRSLLADERSKGGDATPDLVRLPGARLAMASEPEVGATLSESMIKAQTGGEPMIVRAMFRDFFEFIPTHKLVLSFNNKPKILAQDEGTWRRLAMVPWEVTIPEAERDAGLADKILAEEAPGVLAWLLEGYRAWRARGLDRPEAVRAATEEYRESSDPISAFVTACLTQTKHPLQAVRSRDLYDAYLRYAKQNGQEEIKLTRFGKLLVEHGFTKTKGLHGLIYYTNVDLDLSSIDAMEAEERAKQQAADPGPGEGDMR